MAKVCFETALGPMVAVADAEALFLLEFADRPSLETQFRTLQRRTGTVLKEGHNALLEIVQTQVGEFLVGGRHHFELPVAAPGTDFQRRVWEALQAIPYGETRTYAQLAAAIQRPEAARAVGSANGANRLALVIPCHRLVGADGSLTGYAGGTWRKARLLAMEKRTLEAR